MNLEDALWDLVDKIDTNKCTKKKISTQLKLILKNYFIYEEKLLQSVIT